MISRAMLVLALLSFSGMATAQGHKHAHAPPNGGQIVHIGKVEAELVVTGSEMSLFITDENDQKVAAAGYSATAVVLARGNQQRTVQLSPAGENRLAGKYDFLVDGKFRATVTLRGKDGEIGKGRYNLDVR